MSEHTITVIGPQVFVTGPQHPDLDAITDTLGGKYIRKSGEYLLPLQAETTARAVVNRLHQPAAESATVEPGTLPNGMTPGWSKASRRRTAGSHHPLGAAVETGDGYTIYDDETFGGGHVQIWDRS